MAVSAISPIKTEHQCFLCEKLFYPKKTDRVKFCSQECGRKWSGFKAGIRRNSGIVSYTVRKVFCAVCSKCFEQIGNSKYCSVDCIKTKNRIYHCMNASQKSTRDHLDRPCKECGATFAPEYGDKRRYFCSQVCMLRNSKRRYKEDGRKAARRKARKLKLRCVTVESVNPIKVLERDKWTCQLCGIKTPKRLRGSYDDAAPEVDHIIPIAIGGEHSYQNTQCACRKCNLAKGASPKGQMRLFA